MMPSPTRFLQSPGHNHTPDTAAPDASVDSDLIVILVSLLCAVICVVGLTFVARCARLRPAASAASAAAASSSVSARLLPAAAEADKGLKKKILRALPTLSFEAAAGGVTECPICLAEFAEHDRIRVLPHCGHGFHVVCIDTWLGSHSSCPSCRRILAMPAPGPTSAAVLDSRT